MTEYGEVKFCPYWRKVFLSGSHVLALCGKTSPKEPRLPENEISPRFRRCPWFSAEQAYFDPVILECHIDEIKNRTGEPLEIKATLRAGAEGIVDLESCWLNEVEKFIRRHAQPS